MYLSFYSFPDNYALQQNYDNAGSLPSCDNESVVSGQNDDEYVPNDLRDLDGLVSQPCQVCNYSTFSQIKLMLLTFWVKSIGVSMCIIGVRMVNCFTKVLMRNEICW